MSWIKDGNLIKESETGMLVAVLSENCDERTARIIEASKELHEAFESFVEDLDSGSFRPKSTYEKLKSIMSRIPKYA